MARKQIKLVSELVRNYDRFQGKTEVIQILAFNGFKFRIRFEASNGSPLGFNYKKCLSVLTNGKWEYVADYHEIAPDMYSLFGGDNYFTNQLPIADYFIRKCREYIKNVYE